MKTDYSQQISVENIVAHKTYHMFGINKNDFVGINFTFCKVLQLFLITW